MRVVGDLETVIQAVSAYTGLDYDTLLTYANADKHTGWDFNEGEWPIGSLHRPEGQILYALTRALNAVPVEYGSHQGCSATHLAQALADGGISGQVVSVDLNGMNQTLVPAALIPLINAIAGDGHAHLNALPDESQRLIFEDTGHDREGTGRFWREGLPKLVPGGVIVSHDPENALVGANVVAGVEDAGIHDYLIVRVPPSDCGLILYRKPGELPHKWLATEYGTLKVIEDDNAPLPEKRKRKGKRHATVTNG